MLVLYRSSAADYDKLHKASCAVRYENGLAVPLDRVITAYEAVKAAHSSSALVA